MGQGMDNRFSRIHFEKVFSILNISTFGIQEKRNYRRKKMDHEYL